MRPSTKRLEITILSFIMPPHGLLSQWKFYKTLYGTQTQGDDFVVYKHDRAAVNTASTSQHRTKKEWKLTCPPGCYSTDHRQSVLEQILLLQSLFGNKMPFGKQSYLRKIQTLEGVSGFSFCVKGLSVSGQAGWEGAHLPHLPGTESGLK